MTDGLETIVTTNSKQGVLRDDSNNVEYEISGEIGKGGMGVVYRAWVEKKALIGSNTELENIIEQSIKDKTLQQVEKGTGVDSTGAAISGIYIPLAIKIVKEDYLAKQGETAVARFEREAEIQKRYAGNPNVVKVFQSGQGLLKLDGAQNGEQCHYIAMELLNNLMSPEEILNLDEKSKLHISKQMLSVIDQLHADKTIHRDIKPENILITKEKTAKLADFGLGKDNEDMGLTQTGGVLGSPIYMSPEQAMGNPLDHLSDIYSMGATLYELSTGEKPFKVDSGENALFALILNKQNEDFIPKPHPKLSDDLYHILLRAMAVKKERRFPSAVEFRIALDEYERKKYDGETKFDALARTIDVSRSIQKRAKKVTLLRKAKELNKKLTPWQYIGASLLVAAGLYIGYRQTLNYADEKHAEEQLDTILNESVMMKKLELAAEQYKYSKPFGKTFANPAQKDISDFLKLDEFNEYYVAMRIKPAVSDAGLFSVEFSDDKNKHNYAFWETGVKYSSNGKEAEIPYTDFRIKTGEKIELILWKHDYEGKTYLSVTAGEADSDKKYKFILPQSTEYPSVEGNKITINPLESKIEEVIQCGK